MQSGAARLGKNCVRQALAEPSETCAQCYTGFDSIFPDCLKHGRDVAKIRMCRGDRWCFPVANMQVRILPSRSINNGARTVPYSCQIGEGEDIPIGKIKYMTSLHSYLPQANELAPLINCIVFPESGGRIISVLKMLTGEAPATGEGLNRGLCFNSVAVHSKAAA